MKSIIIIFLFFALSQKEGQQIKNINKSIYMRKHLFLKRIKNIELKIKFGTKEGISENYQQIQFISGWKNGNRRSFYRESGYISYYNK